MADTSYLVVSDLELLGPEPKIENLSLAEGSWDYAQIVTGLAKAEHKAAEIGAKHARHGVTVYKVVEVAHYKPVSK